MKNLMQAKFDDLKILGYEIEDFRCCGMSFMISKQPNKKVNLIYSSDKFGISTTGARLFDEQNIQDYLNELENLLVIVTDLNYLLSVENKNK